MYNIHNINIIICLTTTNHHLILHLHFHPPLPPIQATLHLPPHQVRKNTKDIVIIADLVVGHYLHQNKNQNIIYRIV